MTSQEEIDELFKKWEEYIPQPVGEVIDQHPIYIPTPKTDGPKPITIEEYRKRQQGQKKYIEEFRNPQTNYKPKKRGGKKRKFEKACSDLQRTINISKGTQKKRLIEQLIELKKKGWRDQCSIHLN